MAIELSYCVLNTGQRQLLCYCLDAIWRERASVPFETEVLVLDNASGDGSAAAARAHPATTELIALEQRRGKGENASSLLERARGRVCLLLDDDAELEPGTTAALHAALEADTAASAGAAKLLRPDGTQQPSAWRFPGPGSALLGALGLERRLVVQSRGTRVRAVDWGRSAALLVRREAGEAVGWFDPGFVASSAETDFCRRLRTAGFAVLYVPGASAVHHDPDETEDRAIVERSRDLDRYLRKHHTPLAVYVVRWLVACAYTARALRALVTPGADARRFARQAGATLFPGGDEGRD